MSIFKAYDIRGVVPDELNEPVAFQIGKAYASLVGGKTIGVGRDMRATSAGLQHRLMEGLLSCGLNVVDLGLTTTPGLYYGVVKHGLDGGIMTTASHNPAKYNGFKMTRDKAIPISRETGIAEIESRILEGRYESFGSGRFVEERELREDYLDYLLSFAEKPRTLKVVVDASNGMGGLYTEELFYRLPHELLPIFFELDGNFPNHEANPLKEANLVWLKNKVRETGADLGVMLDGDADRCAFVDEEGETVSCDLVTALMAKYFLAKRKGHVLYDLRSSWTVKEEIEANGGIPVEERVGHSFMKATMRRLDAVFGGELSGHYYFRDNEYCDSGEIAMLVMLNILGSHNRPFSELVKPLRRYHSTGEINFEVEDKEGMMKTLASAFPGGEVNWLDGVTARFKDWWFNVRPSNTEPVLRLNMEARTPELLEECKEKLMKYLGEPEE